MNKKIDIRKIINRIIVYILGLFILAFGVALSINSQLGVSPVNSLPYVVSVITGKEMSICVIGIFSCYILVQMILLKKEFKWMNLVQLVFSTIFGYFVDFAKFILGDFTIPTYMGQLVMLAISIILVAIGITLYVNANLINMPMEGMTDAVQKKIFKKLGFYDVKVIMDCLTVGIGIILSWIFLGKVVGIREGTVICAVFVGKIMKQIQKVIVPTIDRLCK